MSDKVKVRLKHSAARYFPTLDKVVQPGEVIGRVPRKEAEARKDMEIIEEQAPHSEPDEKEVKVLKNKKLVKKGGKE